MKKPKHTADRHSLLREVPTALVPPVYGKPPKGKNVEPESSLQAQVDELLAKAGIFQFRLSANLLAHAGDKSVGGWPDDPMIMKIQPGLSLLFPLELKRRGHDLRPNQVEMQRKIGTVMADTWEKSLKYVFWTQEMYRHINKLLSDNPGPEMPL